jgi:hypothetical protein
VVALEHRRDVPARISWGKSSPTLEAVPPEVGPRALASRKEVDLLDVLLPDVADHEVARAAVEREAVRVAKPVRVDLRAGAAAMDERVVVGDPVRTASVGTRIDAEDLPEQRP